MKEQGMDQQLPKGKIAEKSIAADRVIS